MSYNFGSIWNGEALYQLQKLADSNESQGRAIQDLVAEGQLSEAQYAELLATINGMLKSGDVSLFDLNAEVRSRFSDIDNKIDKGDVAVTDIDKNKGKFDGTYFTDAFLADLNGGTINTTNLLDGSVTSAKYANKSLPYNAMSDETVASLHFDNATREFIGSYDNVVLNPPNGVAFTTYANQTGDPYYDSFLGSGTTPASSLDGNQEVLLDASAGYFYYRIKLVGKFAESNTASIILKNSSAGTKVEYRFFDDAYAQVGSITALTNRNGIYGVEGITFPAGATILELRVDNRNNASSTILTNPIVVPARKIRLSDPASKELKTRVEALEAESEKTSGNNLPKIKVSTPAFFDLKDSEINDRIYFDGKDWYATDYDVSEDKLNKGTTYYVDYVNGSNANDGLSGDTPLQALSTALGKADVGEVLLKGGNHFRYNGTWGAESLGKDINIGSYDGTARLIPSDKLEWLKTAGYANVYEVSRSTTGKVVDLSRPFEDGYTEYEEVASIAEVDGTVDTWYTDGTKVYAHATTQPNADELVALINTNNFWINDGVGYFYSENVEFIGGQRPVRSESETIKFYAKNCKFIHGVQSNGNGLEAVGGVSYISQNCAGLFNPMDGFNYHVGATGSLPYFIEIDCNGSRNGALKGEGGSRSDNGSTAHDGVKGIRLNGAYHNNDGGNIADVNAGTQTWNLNCSGFESYQGADFLTSTGAMMILDNCDGFGSTDSILSVDTTDAIYIRRGSYQSKTIAGTEQAY